jgi:rubredoxin
MIINAPIVVHQKSIFKKRKISEVSKMSIYRCKRCNYLYIDDEQTQPFNKLKEDYRCPKCRASKHFFVKKEL